jgi:hypothetical protein
MNVRAWRVLAAVLVAGLGASVARGDPKVASGYAIEKYNGSIPRSFGPVGMAFSHDGEFGRPAELYGHYSLSRTTPQEGRATYRLPGPEESVLFTSPQNASVSMVFPEAKSEFGSYLYAANQGASGFGITRYGRTGTEEVFASIQATAVVDLKFSSGGAWGTNLYLAVSQGPNGNSIERFDASGQRTTLATGMPACPNTMDFSPGGAWGDFLYVGSSASNITKVDPKGNKATFLSDGSALGLNWLGGLAFGPKGEFGGDMFVSSLGNGTVYRITPQGEISTFASGFDFGLSIGCPFSGDLLFGPDGCLYVAEGQTGTIWRIRRTGAIDLQAAGLRRDPVLDMVVLPGGEELKGVITNESFGLATPFGGLEIPGERVVGMIAGEGGAVKCVLADGQVVRGRLDGPGVRIVQPKGGRRPVTVARFSQWSRCVSAEHPVGAQPRGPLLVTRDGQELLIDPDGISLTLKTRWGQVGLDSGDLIEIDAPRTSAERPNREPLEKGLTPACRVRFASGSVLLGTLAGKPVSVKPRLGGRLEVPPDQIVRLKLDRAEEHVPWLARLELPDGEILAGALAQQTIRVRTAKRVVEVSGPDVREIVAVPEIPGGVRVKLAGGGEVAGLLDQEDVSFLMLPGPELRIPAEKIIRLTCPSGGPVLSLSQREQIAKKILAILRAKSPQPGVITRYSEGIAHFDDWIPFPDTLLENAPNRQDYYRWQYVAGRVVRVDRVKDGKARSGHQVWYDENGAPILCLSEIGFSLGEYAWAEYDSRRLLHRVVHFNGDLTVRFVDLFLTADDSSATTQFRFDGKGALVWRNRHTAGGVYLWTAQSGAEKQVNYGSRLEWLRHLERYGLASMYPIPPAKGVGAPPRRPVLRVEQFESGELRLQDVDKDRLEEFLQDLIRRRDYDRSQHEGQAGPDGPFLSAWISKVMQELARRGRGERAGS